MSHCFAFINLFRTFLVFYLIFLSHSPIYRTIFFESQSNRNFWVCLFFQTSQLKSVLFTSPWVLNSDYFPFSSDILIDYCRWVFFFLIPLFFKFKYFLIGYTSAFNSKIVNTLEIELSDKCILEGQSIFFSTKIISIPAGKSCIHWA